MINKKYNAAREASPDYITAFSVAALATLFLWGNDISPAELLRLVSESFVYSVTAVALLYFFNSVTYVLSLPVLYIVCGFVLPPFWAAVLNAAGSVFCFSSGYFKGRRCRRVSASPIASALSRNGKSGFFPSFLFRALRFFPAAESSFYLGSARVPFMGYLFGSLLGSLPSMLLAASVSTNVVPAGSFNPLSVLTALLSALFMVFIKYRYTPLFIMNNE